LSNPQLSGVCEDMVTPIKPRPLWNRWFLPLGLESCRCHMAIFVRTGLFQISATS
jgi:hypothetical protein